MIEVRRVECRRSGHLAEVLGAAVEVFGVADVVLRCKRPCAAEDAVGAEVDHPAPISGRHRRQAVREASEFSVMAGDGVVRLGPLLHHPDAVDHLRGCHVGEEARQAGEVGGIDPGDGPNRPARCPPARQGSSAGRPRMVQRPPGSAIRVSGTPCAPASPRPRGPGPGSQPRHLVAGPTPTYSASPSSIFTDGSYPKAARAAEMSARL